MAAEPDSWAPAKVLVVDDAEEIRLLLSLTLGADERFEVVGLAADGLEAVEKTATTRPDLIVLDQTMPGPSGVDVLPDLLERAPAAAVVIYTAGCTPLLQQAVAAGAADVVDKLTVGGELVERLASILESWNAGGSPVIDLDRRTATHSPREGVTRPSLR